MKTLIDTISTWKPIDPQERIEQLQNKETRRHPARFILGEELSPLDLYAYLKTRFGPPNGFQMALRTPTSDNLIHWHYTIKASASAVLDIWQANLTTEIIVEGVSPPSHTDWDQLISAIKADFSTHGAGMSRVRNKLESWHLFVNPYKRLRNVLSLCHDELKSLNVDCVDVPRTPETPHELRELHETIVREKERFAKALTLGVTIRMLAPVLGEAFVNFLIFLLAKVDIKTDQRLYQDVIRRDIDVRVKSMHLNCNGFSKPVDTNTETFGTFRTLMNNRNDFLHGNVDPTKLKYDTVYFDYRTVPIFERRASFGELAFSHRLIHVEPDRAFEDLDAVSKFIDLVLESLEPQYRELVEAFMRTTSPGWRPKDGKVGILFPEQVIHSVPGDMK